jgi:hypothetical protein
MSAAIVETGSMATTPLLRRSSRWLFSFQSVEQIGRPFQHFASGVQIVSESGAGHIGPLPRNKQRARRPMRRRSASHTRPVLRAAGFSNAEIDALMECGRTG